ncbi:BlaI/MecI/CopY family transcriptional regulator [Rhabdobacter roseus]|uniref:Putative transcriptional regulator n=1 Tax=Rhabdobacter roseus TaxID=1655419 RepID=A0A840TS21_9BACT|nr:BlaI/MecI/CopY family transcriptional regulator [Rhabdobacter roseus]MBB5282810.1 putative transcriptional regulator [Rhabdobacter roseus]
MKLTEAEVLLMHHLWQLDKAFMKDLLDAYPDPKPAPTTVATLLKRMINKGFVAYREYGNSREYYPLVKKEAYFSNQMAGLITDFFDDSAGQFASYFAASANLSTSELEDLKNIIDQQLQKKKP